MEELKTLQGQFKSAASQFPEMIHLTKRFRIGVVESKLEFDPDRPLGRGSLAILNQASRKAVETPSKYEPTSEKQIHWWSSDPDSSCGEDFYECHWLLRPESSQWSKPEALGRLKSLTKSAVCYIIDEHKKPIISSIFSEIGSAIINASEEQHIQGWLSVVRHLRPEGTAKRVFDAENDSLSAAEAGKPYFSTIDDVFRQSALVCTELLGQAQRDMGQAE